MAAQRDNTKANSRKSPVRAPPKQTRLRPKRTFRLGGRFPASWQHDKFAQRPLGSSPRSAAREGAAQRLAPIWLRARQFGCERVSGCFGGHAPTQLMERDARCDGEKHRCVLKHVVGSSLKAREDRSSGNRNDAIGGKNMAAPRKNLAGEQKNYREGEFVQAQILHQMVARPVPRKDARRQQMINKGAAATRCVTPRQLTARPAQQPNQNDSRRGEPIAGSTRSWGAVPWAFVIWSR